MNPTAASQQQFCVRWNSHLGSLGAAFPQLLAGQRFVDVTLACEGHQLHCHRLVLAACSTYFESLLSENPCKHPIVIMPHDIKLWEIQALVDFMYKGEVNVSQAGLTDLLKCAELLQIRGLCGADAALNLNAIANNAISSTKDTNNGSITTADGVPQSGDIPPTAEIATGGAPTIGSAIATLNAATAGAGGTTTVTTALPASSSSLSAAPLSSGLTLAPPALLSAVNPANSHSNSALKPPGGGNRSNSALMSCHSPSNQTIGGGAGGSAIGLNNTKRMIVSLAAFEASTASNVAKLHQQYSTSTPNTSAILTPKLEPVDVSIVDDMDDDSINNVVDVTKTEREDVDYTEPTIKQPNEKQLHHPTKTQQHLIENLDDDIDDSYRKEKRKYKRNIYKYLKSGHSRPPMLDHDYDEENVFIDESDESDSETINDNKIKENLEEVGRNSGQQIQGEGQSQNQDEIEGVQERGRDQYQNEDQDNDQSEEAQEEDQQIDDIKGNCYSSTDRRGDQGRFRNNLRKRPSPGLDENLPVPKKPTVILKPIGQLQNLGGASSSTSSTAATTTGTKFGKIRVKPNENLYENYSKIESINNETEDEMIQQLPASLKFNKDEMTIFVKNPEGNERNSITPGPLIRTVRSLAGSHSAPPSLEIISKNDSFSGVVGAKCTTTNVRIVGGPIMSSSSSGSSSAGSPSGCDETSLRSMGLICYDTPEIGETTTVKTEVVISEEEMDSSSNCENIVCSPNVHDYNNFNNDEADDEDDDDEDGVVREEQLIKSQGDETFKEEPPFDDIRLDENFDSTHDASHQVVTQHMGTQANIPTIIIPTLATYTTHQPFANTNPRLLSTNAQCKVPPRSSILKSAYLVTYNKATGRYRELVGPITVGNMNSTLNSGIRYPSSSSSGVSIVQEKKNQTVGDAHGSQGDIQNIDGHNSSPNPSPSAVVLRNPRSNQPRSYSTEALYAALMDVKAGESIYRASQLHKVPRKTLRNWMKRWHIKSAFPMPRQLKQAAEKKRLKQMEHKMEKYNV